MKVKKKRKKVILQIGMICALIFSFIRYIPDVVYADTSSVNWTQYWYRSVSSSNKNYIEGYKTTASGKHVTFYSPNCFYTCIISTTDLSSSGSYDEYKSVYGKDGPTFTESNNTTYHKGSFTYNGAKYFFIYSGTYGDTSSYRYVGYLGALYNCPDDYLGSASRPLISGAICDYIAGHLPYTCTLVCDGGEDGEVSTDVGSVNNPIEDSEIGTIEISGKAYAQDTTANSDNIDEQFYTMWNWKNKTSTGFSLTKNKYHMTRIQVMVESRCLVYSDLKHKTVKEKFENYGERNKLKNGILPTDKPYTIYLKDVMSALPKTKGEFHNVLFCGYNFKYYWRVMCNDSPTGTGKWYCGGWRAVDLNQDSNKSKDINDTNNGHFDDDENWVNDEDDGHNNTTDYSDDVSGQNPDDAKDTITNPKKDKDDKFGWDDFKSLINECKQVPGLIKSVFSFLPDWVLAFVAIGFGIWIFVLIKRAIV